MRKIAIVLMGAALSLCLFGCSQEEPKEEDIIEPKTSEPISSDTKADSDKSEIKISESGWSASYYGTKENGVYVNYAYILSNPNKESMAMSPTVKLTVKDVDGKILASETSYAVFVGPGDIMPVAGRTDTLSGEPAEVTFELGDSKSEAASYDDMYHITDFVVSGISENIISDDDMNWTGEFTNPTDKDIENGVTPIVVLFNGGEIVGGFSNNLAFDSVAANATTSFEIDPIGNAVPEHDSFEVYIIPNIF